MHCLIDDTSCDICDLLWRNREQVACDIQLFLGLSTNQQCMVSWSVKTIQINRPAFRQEHAIVRCNVIQLNINQNLPSLPFRVGCMVDQIGYTALIQKSDTSRSDLFPVSPEQVTSTICSYKKRNVEHTFFIRTRRHSQRSYQAHPNDIIELLGFVLTTTYFSFRAQIYRQIFGAAMGSPVSAIVANLFME